MSIYQHHLDEEALLVAAIKNGDLNDPELNVPDHHIETGLAHIFFFGDKVFKQYKIVGDEDHFIKGVLAPTQRRQKFIERDFALNQHFSGGVYKKLHAHGLSEGQVHLSDLNPDSVHVLCEMDKLDFTQNFHEQLLQKKVGEDDLFALGYFTAESVELSPISAPREVNWYELAKERIFFLETFIGWLPEECKEDMQNSGCVTALKKHLEDNRSEYETRTGESLVVSLDNHDENIFFKEGKPLFIDVVPPMQSWWYGIPVLNLANISVNVEVLMSPEKARHVEEGFMSYHGIDALPVSEYAFTRALALAISAVHFGSTPGKEEIGQRYIARCQEIHSWL